VQWDNRYGESGKQHKFLIEAKSSKKNLENYERLFFDLYKRQNDKQTFDTFLNYAKDYRLISYFFFIKKKGDDAYMQKDRYLPIVPTTFDKIFEKLGVEKYKAYGNCTFENYSEFISIVKEVREYLAAKLDELVTILDAHSFLWILGNEMEKEKTQVKKSTVLTHQVNTNTTNENTPYVNTEIDEPPSLLKTIDDNVDETILAEIKRRRGQSNLRENLFLIYNNRCCITDCDIKEVLHACHINPHSECGDNSVNNALLLRSDIHDLFDSHLIGIRPESLTVHLNPKLLNTEYKQLEGKKIARGKEINKIDLNLSALQLRWKLFESGLPNNVQTVQVSDTTDDAMKNICR